MDVHVGHELRRVHHDHVLDRSEVGVLQRRHRAQVGDAFLRRNLDRLHERRRVQRRQPRLVEEELELLQRLPLGHAHGHLHARGAADFRRQARRHDADAERLVAGVDHDLVAGDRLSFFVERHRADAVRLRDVAEVDVERVRGRALRHDLAAVERKLHRRHAAGDQRVDVLQAAEELVGKRHDAQHRLVGFDLLDDARDRRLVAGAQHLRHVRRGLDDGLAIRIGVGDFDAQRVRRRAQKAVDDDRHFVAGRFGGIVEAVAEVLEHLAVFEHFADHVDAVRLRRSDLFHHQLRPRDEDHHLRVGTLAVPERKRDRDVRRQLRRAGRGDDHLLQDALHRLLVDRRRREDLRRVLPRQVAGGESAHELVGDRPALAFEGRL